MDPGEKLDGLDATKSGFYGYDVVPLDDEDLSSTSIYQVPFRAGKVISAPSMPLGTQG